MRGAYIQYVLDQLDVCMPDEIIGQLLDREQRQSGVELAQTQAHLGFCFVGGLEDREDHSKSSAYYRKSALGGDPVGMQGFATALYYEHGVERDIDEACRWYHRAWDGGVVSAWRELQQHYAQVVDECDPETDFDVWASTDEGMKNCMCWWKNALELPQWSVSGIRDRLIEINPFYQIGLCYELGIGVDQSNEEALAWFIRSVEDGCSFA